MFEQCDGAHPDTYLDKPKEFAAILNGSGDANRKLRRLFREAVAEAEPTTEEAAAAGLGNLFAGCE